MMSKIKKWGLIIWGLNILSFVYLFTYGRITNTDFLNIFEFKYIRLILLIYMMYDYFKINLASNNIDSQIMYVVCLIICIVFIIAGVTFFIKLNYYRISEFSFFVIIASLLRIGSMSVKVPNFLILKEK